MASWIDVHLLDADSADEPDGDCLDAMEQARAARFRRPRDRRHYRARHAFVRRRLGLYLGARPADLCFELNDHGKPGLAGGGLHFNLSHSRGLALLVVARDRPVGCDVEWRDAAFPHLAVGRQVFTAQEQIGAGDLASLAALQAFFARWTCKEAYVKALGCGLSLPLDAFDVDIDDRGPRLGRGCDGWSVRTFEPRPGFQAAVVAEGDDWSLRFRP
jgi:4'-phosphopantetheinyl transferase